MKCPMCAHTRKSNIGFSDCASADVSSSCQCQMLCMASERETERKWTVALFVFHLNQCSDTLSTRADGETRSRARAAKDMNDKRFSLLIDCVTLPFTDIFARWAGRKIILIDVSGIFMVIKCPSNHQLTILVDCFICKKIQRKAKKSHCREPLRLGWNRRALGHWRIFHAAK